MAFIRGIDQGIKITAANADGFDIKKFEGRVYAVRTADSVVIKDIFASLGNFFEFLANAFFNNKNTFIRSRNITQIVADLKVTNVAKKILTPPPPPSPPSKTQEESLKQKYYQLTDQFIPFNLGVIENLRSTKKGSAYIASELKSLTKLLDKTEKNEKAVLEFEKSLGASQLRDGLKELREKIQNFVCESLPVSGIKNAGNSCYMNSALQGLLGSKYVINSIKEHKGNEPFMPALQRFITAYEKIPQDFKEIGDNAADLRYKLYTSNLRNMGVEEYNDMVDADLVLIAIAEALGNKLNFGLVSDLAADNGIHRLEYTNQLIWPHLNTDGSKLSAQQLFNKQCEGIVEQMDSDGWKTEKGTVYQATRSYYIEDSNPPQLLALKVGLVHGINQNAPFTPYKVSARDATLDASAAFGEGVENAQYRLIGILENHSRVHWTAKSLRNGIWYDCNDGTVKELGTKVPKSSAAILLYERM